MMNAAEVFSVFGEGSLLIDQRPGFGSSVFLTQLPLWWNTEFAANLLAAM